MCGIKAPMWSLLSPIKQLKAINAMRRNEYHVAFL
jgi:hypothetical protein